jgi:hypothetical protein
VEGKKNNGSPFLFDRGGMFWFGGGQFSTPPLRAVAFEKIDTMSWWDQTSGAMRTERKIAAIDAPSIKNEWKRTEIHSGILPVGRSVL